MINWIADLIKGVSEFDINNIIESNLYNILLIIILIPIGFWVFSYPEIIRFKTIKFITNGEKYRILHKNIFGVSFEMKRWVAGMGQSNIGGHYKIVQFDTKEECVKHIAYLKEINEIKPKPWKKCD